MATRLTFPHVSSSADLLTHNASTKAVTTLNSPAHRIRASQADAQARSNRTAPLSSNISWNDRSANSEKGLPEPPRTLSLHAPTPLFRSYSPTPSRSPSPHPFAIPRFEIPSLETVRFVSLCTLWYSCSALSSNTGKVILNNFRFPVTLTIVQFFFVAMCCVLSSRPSLRSTIRLRTPSRAILTGTLPMAIFQVVGHIFSSLAMSRVPVSTVHTIKALSPLFTVLAYALIFGVSYSAPTYVSLLPLTLGVMLATSVDISLSNVFGLFCAFGSTLVFVSQNIFFKRILPTHAESAPGTKLDKINLLYFSSGTAFVLMIPLWFYSDATRIWHHQMSPTAPSIFIYFVLNGLVHFAQNLLAFAILSSTSPVTYSIASLVKRIAVICLAIVWFQQAVHPIQAVGIGLTGIGLLMYNNAKRDVEKGEKKMRQVEAVREGVLPISRADQRLLRGDVHRSPKPNYDIDFISESQSSALKSFQLPPPSQMKALPSGNPYPSPPPSITSSPPSPPAPLAALHPSTADNKIQSHRQRKMSIDSSVSSGQNAQPYRPGQPPIMEQAAGLRVT